MTSAAEAPRPLLQVVRGEPSPEQLAALIAVVASRGGAAAAPAPVVRRWRSPVRAPLPPAGPGVWRASAWS